LADLALIIANKRGDVGMLLTMGSTPERLRRAFVLLGGLLALAGTALGAVAGVGVSMMADRFRLLRLPGDVFFVEYVPFLVRPGDLALILGMTLVLALAASFYGAQKAAALDPVEALRR
ncbi:MAG: FtsX-like permease family protein, partial [Acidobacteriota bacterium]